MSTPPLRASLDTCQHEDLMQVMALQHAMIFEEALPTLDRIECLLEQSAAERQSIVPKVMVFPEMCATGYTMNPLAALRDHDHTHKRMTSIAKNYGAYVIYGGVEEGESGPENRAICLTPSGERLPSYAKIHPFSHTGEDKIYASGTELVIWEIEGRRLCPLICYDLRFPEIFRKAVKQGVDAFVVIASFPAKRREHWLALLKARAIENQCYVLGVNRCGDDPVAHYAGDTVIYNYQGQELNRLDDQPGLLTEIMNFHWQEAYQDQYQFLKDMRWA